jgi:hypothetical protein
VSATVLGEIAAGIASLLRTIPDIEIVYEYEPDAPDARPAATVEGPTEVERRDVEEAESQLGAFDWRTTWTVRIYAEVVRPDLDAQTIRALLGQFIAAVDADPTLAGTAQLGASVVRSATAYMAKGEQEHIAAECELHAWSLIPQ